MPKWECKNCKESDYFVLSTAVNDIVCESCGEWQDAILNDVWERVG